MIERSRVVQDLNERRDTGGGKSAPDPLTGTGDDHDSPREGERWKMLTVHSEDLATVVERGSHDS